MTQQWRNAFLTGILLFIPNLLLAGDLEVLTSSAPDPVYENGTITYTIVVSNIGVDPVTSVSLENTLSSAVTYQSHNTAVGVCSELSGVVTCDLGDMASSASETVTITASTGSAQDITLQSTVSATETDSDLSNNTYNHTTEVKSTGEFLVGAIDGGSVHRFSYDPRNSDIVYASTIGAGVFKSVDDGNSWSPIFLPSLSGHFVNHVLPSAETDDLVLVCAMAPSGAAIWRSTDGGLNFDNVMDVTVGACHHIAEGNPANVYYAAINTGDNASSVGHVYKSIDGGATWTELGGTINGYFITNIVPLAGTRLVVGTQDGGSGGFTGKNNQGDIYYSDDDGASWTEVTNQNFTEAVLGFAYNSPSLLLAAISDGTNIAIWSSSDGENWSAEQNYAGVGNVNKNPLLYHAASDTFYLMYEKLIASGTGPSYLWNASPTDLMASMPSYYLLKTTRNQAFTLDPDSSNTILIGLTGADAVARTDDGGTSWSFSNEGYSGASIDIATKDLDSGYRYAANREGIVYFASSSLSEWKMIFHADATNSHLTTVAFDQSNPAKVFIAFTDGTILVNNDAVSNSADTEPFAHSSWSAVTSPNGSAVAHAIWADGTTIFMGMALADNTGTGNYLYKSIDNGTSWNPVTTLTTTGGVRTLIAHPMDSNIMYAGSGDYSSSPSSAPPPTAADGIYKSTDGGATWSALDSNATLNQLAPRLIVIDPDDTTRVWLQTFANPGGPDNELKLWESLDGGASWAEITPTNGFGGAIAYISTDDVLLVAGGSTSQNINVLQLKPGACSSPCSWSDAFGVYGEANALYNGSVGIGTGSGLFEFSSVPSPSSSGNSGGGGGGGGGIINPLVIILLAIFFTLAFFSRRYILD